MAIALLFLVLSGSLLGQTPPGAYSSPNIGGSNSGSSAALSNNAWYLSQNCNGASNCTQVFADTRYVIDATSNSTTTVTCPNNDCNFTSADVGKKVWATTQGSGAGVGFLIFTTFVCPVTTIAAVNGAQSITLNSACTANGTANVVLIWGHDDGTALATLDSTAGCSAIYMPGTGKNTLIMTSQPFLVNAPSSSQCLQQLTLTMGNPAPQLYGAGSLASGGSTLVITPDFNWANCKAITGASKNVCIGGTADVLSGFGVWGTGLTSATNSGCSGAANKIMVSGSPIATQIYGVFLAGICPGAAGMIGIEGNSFDGNMDQGGAASVGTIACNFHGSKGLSTRGDDCRNDNVTNGVGYNVEAGAQVQGAWSMQRCASDSTIRQGPR